MSLFSSPSAAASTILARSTSRAATLRPRAHRWSVARSSSVNVIETATRMGFILLIEDETRNASHMYRY